jgi:hypothetical protein
MTTTVDFYVNSEGRERAGEDGYPAGYLVYFITGVYASGRRIAHHRYFDDEAEANRLLARIHAAGDEIDDAHWVEGLPVYGSLYYQRHGGEATLCALESRSRHETGY